MKTDRFFTTFTLISRIPVTRKFTMDFSRSDFWIPAISPLVSLAALAGYAAGILLTGSSILAVLASIALQYFAFNLFHLDGLIDSADAMLPAATPERRLEILKDPRIGTYGFFAGVMSLAFRAGAMHFLAGQGIFFIALVAGLLAAPLAGRIACALVPLISKPARPDGLGALMKDFSMSRIVKGALLACIPLLAFSAIAFLGSPDAGSWILRSATLFGASLLAVISGSCASAFGIARMYNRKIGGFTGDSLGAAVELGETAALLFLTVILNLSGGLYF